MKKLRDIMRSGFLFMVQRETSVREAVQVMTAHNVGIVLVLEGDRLVGVFSERDVVRHSLVQRIIRAYEEFDQSRATPGGPRARS